MQRIKDVSEVIEEHGHSSKLAKTLTAFDLTAIGIAILIGAGIFVLTGTAAATRAGPGVALSFILGGIGCGLTALCYSELAASVPTAGSAYAYTYISMGEAAAWTVGWALILEYTVGAITVAIGWAGYFTKMLAGLGIVLPEALTRGYFDGGIVNLPAVGLIFLVTALLILGVKESARVATILVVIKMAVIALFLVLGTRHVKASNWSPFLPFGWKGVLSGTGMIFFSYIGFDAITTAAEETKNPQRDLAIGILGSLSICTLLYIAVSAVLTGMVPYAQLNHPAPVALALEHSGITWGNILVTLGAVVGLSSVVLVFMMGQPRIFMAMGRDGLMPRWLSAVHPRYQTPHRSILITSLVVALGSGTMPIHVAGEMTSIGTLCAFILVCLSVVVLRKTHPELPRSFKVPGSPWLPLGGVIICAVIMAGLSGATWLRFGLWLAAGWLIYAAYGYRNSTMATQRSNKAAQLSKDLMAGKAGTANI